MALSTEVTFGLAARALGAAAGGVEGGAGDPVDLRDRVLAGVVGDVALASGVAEVDAAGQLADDEQVGAGDPLLAQRAGADQGRAGPDRAQVGVEAHPLAQPEQALLGARRARVGGVPLRAADGAKQDRVGALAGLEDLVGEGDAVLVDRAATHQALVVGELAEGGEHLARGGDDLGADPVAGKDDYAGRASLTGPPLYASSGSERLDVEADVVEDERLSLLRQDRLGEGPALLLRQLVEDRAEGDGGDELQRALAGCTGFGCSQQRASAKPAAAQARLGLLRRGEVPERLWPRSGAGRTPGRRRRRRSPGYGRRRCRARRTGRRGGRPASARRAAAGRAGRGRGIQWKVAVEKTRSTGSGSSSSTRSETR